jgi:hypothetical protein
MLWRITIRVCKVYKEHLWESATARSFGGLRMTEIAGASSPSIQPIIDILRPPKELAVFCL